jgi:hypothetical protein
MASDELDPTEHPAAPTIQGPGRQLVDVAPDLGPDLGL